MMKYFLRLTAVVAFSALTAGAQTTYQWTKLVSGAADGSWTNAANWSPAGPVGGTDNTAQFNLPVTNSATLTLDGSTTVGNLFFGNTSASAIGWTVNPGTPGSSALTLNVASGSPTITITNQSATFGAALAGTQGFTLNGGGALNLNVADTYTGLTTVNGGALVLNHLNSIAAGNSVTIANGAVLQPKLAGTYANVATTINGVCVGYGSFGGALDFHSGGATSVTWPGQINLNAANATIGSYGVTYTVTLAGQLTGSGGFTIRPEGGSAVNHTSTFIVSNSTNNYAGSTTVQVGTAQQSSTLKLGATNGLPVTTTLNLNRAGSSGVVSFDLAGFGQTVSGLSANYISNAVFNSSGTVATFTVSNAANATFNGVIGTSGKAGINLVKQGGGTLTLNNTNIYTGSTTIGAGTLALNGSITASSSLLMSSNATFQPRLGGAGGAASITVSGNATLAGQISVSDFGIVSNTSYPVIFYNGTLTNNGVTVSPTSPWGFSIVTNVAHVVSLVATQKFPMAQFSGTNFAVNTLTTNLSGILRGTPVGPIWYEVRDQTNRMWDFGATLAQSPWNITVRHLRAGTNTVTIFAQDNAGNIQSNSIQLTLTLGANPGVRPRLIPSEIWWGGLADNNQMTNFSQWPFVQRYQDGFFFHTAGWSPASSAQGPLMQTLAANLIPFNTKYCPEIGGDCVSPSTTWYQGQTNTWGGWVLNAQNVGIYCSEVTHDYHMENMKRVCQVNPTWSNNDQIAWWTGDLTGASGTYPYTSGIWRDVFNGYYQMLPHLKIGLTSSPVWWGWGIYPAFDGNDLSFTVTNNSGGNVPFSFTADPIMVSFVNMASAINHPYYSQQTDCPWDYFGFDGILSTAVQNRQKIRAYEQDLQARGARHTLICNVGNASAANQGSTNAANLYYENSSLSSMIAHQREGGRANRYLYESWYFGIPYAVVPETQAGTYTHLALTAIKYLKGIADTNGNLEQLNLTPLATNGTVVQLQLQNNGDVQCLAALAGQIGNVPSVSTRYFTTNGAEITATVLTAEGFCFTNLLQPSAKTNLFAVTLASGISVPTNENASLEAFWNPQDPLGIVRDRKNFSAPLAPPGFWNDADIGSVGVAGGSALSGTNFTVLGSGGDIWGTADGFHFLYQTNNGDGTITARVASQTAADIWSKAGVMVRETTAAGSREVMMCVSASQGVSFQNRATTGGTSFNNAVGGLGAPYWVRLTRSGTTFTAQYSPNGTSWTTLGSSNITGFATSALWGLAVTAHNNALASAATFDSVAMPNAAPVLNTISNRTLIAGQTLTITNTATDANSPPQTLTFGIVSAPANAQLNAASGIFTWRPTIAQSPSTNLISLNVTDSGVPALSATQNFTVLVLRPALPATSTVTMSNGIFSVRVSGDAGPDYIFQTASNLNPPIVWQPLQTNQSTTPPFMFTDFGATNFNQGFYRVLLGP